MKPPLPPLPPLPQLPPPGLLSPLVPGLTAAGGDFPVGAVVAFAGTSGACSLLEAAGWMVCDGRSLDRYLYEELFNALGYTYSATESGRDFQIPNFQGYFLRGVDPHGTVDQDLDLRTSVSGEPYSGVGSNQDSAFQLHEHRLSAAKAVAQPSQSGTEAGTTGATTEDTTQVVPEPGVNALHTSKYESRPINVSVYFIVRYRNEPRAPSVAPRR